MRISGRGRMAAVLREPMLHFLALAAAIFLAWNALAPPPRPDSDVIQVTAEDFAALAAKFRSTWGRDPSATELKGEVDRYLREEVYYREALAMGLDRNDQVVRVRMGQKIEFLLTDPAAVPAPTEAQLQEFYTASAPRYAAPDTVSFHQVFLGTPADGEVATALAQLQTGAPVDSVGRASLLPSGMETARAAAVDSTFGDGFFQQLVAVPPGAWAGPLTSGYGEHLVRVDSLTTAPPPAFAAVRAAVEADWRREETRKAAEAAYQRLKAHYRIDLSQSGLAE